MSIQTGSFKKAYLEITNICNASCTFCPGNSREKKLMTAEEFDTVLSKLKGRVEYLYFHLMGEPLLHPLVCEFARKAKCNGFKIIITTNGILSKKVGIPLIETGGIYKISISLHSFESNEYNVSFESYLNDCLYLAEEAAKNNVICALRLWNLGGKSELNDKIIQVVKSRFGAEFTPVRTGYKVAEYVFLEYGERFDWPGDNDGTTDVVFCHALRNQIGILSNGTVVPCCLDAEGRINLGNIYDSTLDEILSSDRAKTLYDGFSCHKPTEELCKSCGYAKRFKK